MVPTAGADLLREPLVRQPGFTSIEKAERSLATIAISSFVIGLNQLQDSAD
jgi:hypothetical protein